MEGRSHRSGANRPERVRVLVATTVPSTIAAFLLPYADRYRDAGSVVDGAADQATEDHHLAGHFDRIWNVPWKRNPLHPLNLVAFAIFCRAVRRRRYTIVHLHTPVAAFIGRVAISRIDAGHRPAVVYTAHGFHFTADSRGLGARVFLGLERAAARWTDFLIVLTADDEKLASAIGFPPHRVARTSGVGVDSDHYESSRVPSSEIDALRQRLGIRDSSTHLFACVAEFIPRKRQVDLVRALALVNEDVHVAFAGAGPTEPAVRALASALGLSERVHFLGNVPDVRPLLVAATAVVLPSDREGLPRSLLEAMSLATPIIASDIRGNRELASRGGVVVPCRDSLAIAKAMQTLVGDPAMRRRLGEAGRTAVLDVYDFKRVATQHDAVYAQVLAARSSRQPRD